MNHKKIIFIALLILLALVVVAVAVFLIDPPTDNIPDDLQSYVSPDKGKNPSGNSGGMQIGQDNSNGKYGEMKGPN